VLSDSYQILKQLCEYEVSVNNVSGADVGWG
jgi:hypothetical protein